MRSGDGKMIRIGVLALQGAVAEHLRCLKEIAGVEAIAVKNLQQLQAVNSMILPGGESTAMGKLLRDYGLMAPLRERILNGMPVWGTCAGMILMANHIINQPESYLQVLDVRVKRNAYGGQLESFCTRAVIPSVSPHRIPLTFIRAPYIEQVGPGVRVLLNLDDHIVAVEQDNILATSFHPELTDDLSFHRYFIRKSKEALALVS